MEFERPHPRAALLLARFFVRIYGPRRAGRTRRIGAQRGVDELDEPVLDVGQPGLDSPESLDRYDRWPIVIFLAAGERFDDRRIGQPRGLAGATGARPETIEEFEEGAPIPQPDKPIVEIKTQKILQVPAQGDPVAADGVYEVGVPPGTSPAPGPKKCSMISR